MEITVSDLKELKLLVECIDVERISETIETADGWGTAAVIIMDSSKNPPGVLPVSGAGKSGSIINPRGDNYIVTQNPKAFVWFARIMLFSNLRDIDNGSCFQLLPLLHLAYCMQHPDGGGTDIKDELLYLCDMLIQRHEDALRSQKSQRFFDDDIDN